MTLEEFGVDLFAALKTIGSIMAVQDQYAGAVNRSNKEAMEKALLQRTQLKTLLQGQLDKLSDADAAEIVRRYPWILV